MYNKKLLLTALKNLNQTKTPVKKKDVEESPLEKLKKGGVKKFSSNLGAKNVLYTKNSLYKKPKKNPLYKKPNYKNKIYDPYGMAFDDGGIIENNPGGPPEEFYKNWYQNRVMPTPEGQKLLEKIRPEALERASQNVPYIYSEELNPDEAGYYDTETQQILLNKFLPEAQIEATKQHEFGHHIQAGDKFYDVLGKPHQYLVEQNIIGPKEINTGNPEWDKNLKKNYDDITNPDEIHARIMTLRNECGFKPDQVITEKDIEDCFKRKKEAGEALDPDIEDLKGVTKGNQSIVNLLNDMVSVPTSQDDMLYAKNGGVIEIEIDESDIDKYVKGGYIVEDISVPSLTRMDDGGTNTCPPDYYWNGQTCVTRTYTEIDPRYIAEHPDEARRIQNEGEVIIEREGSDIGKLRAEFREKNPMDIFLDEKKRQFLKKNKGLNKSAGVTMEKFPEDVLQNFMKEYEYKTNNYAVNKLGKKEGWNPKRRGEWVDELTPGERDAVAESKYGSKLQPSYWSRSLAGLQELGNEAIKLLPGEQGDVMKFNIPGLTKKEQKEIRESTLGALETFAPMDMQGAWLANVAKNTGLSTGSDYKELPGILSTEKMPNVDDTDALALNLGTYAGLEALPELGINLVRGIGRGSLSLGKGLAKKIAGSDYTAGYNKLNSGLNTLGQKKALLNKKLVNTAGKLPDSLIERRLWEFTNPNPKKRTITSVKQLEKELKFDLYRYNKLKKQHPDLDFNNPAIDGYLFTTKEGSEKIPGILKTINQNEKSGKSFATYVKKDFDNKMNFVKNSGNSVLKNIVDESPQYLDDVYTHLKNPIKTDEQFVNDLTIQSNTYTRFMKNANNDSEYLNTVRGSNIDNTGYSMDVEGVYPSGWYGSYGYRIQPTIDRAREIFQTPLAEKWSKRIPTFQGDMKMVPGMWTGLPENVKNALKVRDERINRNILKSFEGEDMTHSIPIKYRFNNTIMQNLPEEFIQSKYYTVPQHQVFNSPKYGQKLEGFETIPLGKLQDPKIYTGYENNEDYARFFEGTGKGFKEGGQFELGDETTIKMYNGGTNPCPPDHYWNGEACVPTGRTFTPIDPNYIAQHPDEATYVINEAEVEVNPPKERVPLMMQFSNEFQENNPYDAYYEKAAYDYLKKSKKNWDDALGINIHNLPENVAKRIQNNYYKDLQKYIIDKSKKTQKEYMGKFDKKGNWIPLNGKHNYYLLKNNILDPLSKRPTGHGSWDNYGDGPIQMVYPEQFFMGPGAGMLGFAGRTAAKSIAKLANYAPIASAPLLTPGNALNAYFAYEAVKPDGNISKAVDAFSEGDIREGAIEAAWGALGILPFVKPTIQGAQILKQLKTPGSIQVLPKSGNYSFLYKSPAESGLLVGNPNLNGSQQVFKGVTEAFNKFSRYANDAGAARLGEFKIMKQTPTSYGYASTVAEGMTLGDMTTVGQTVKTTTPALVSETDEFVDLYRIEPAQWDKIQHPTGPKDPMLEDYPGFFYPYDTYGKWFEQDINRLLTGKGSTAPGTLLSNGADLNLFKTKVPKSKLSEYGVKGTPFELWSKSPDSEYIVNFDRATTPKITFSNTNEGWQSLSGNLSDRFAIDKSVGNFRIPTQGSASMEPLTNQSILQKYTSDPNVQGIASGDDLWGKTVGPRRKTTQSYNTKGQEAKKAFSKDLLADEDYIAFKNRAQPDPSIESFGVPRASEDWKKFLTPTEDLPDALGISVPLRDLNAEKELILTDQLDLQKRFEDELIDFDEYVKKNNELTNKLNTVDEKLNAQKIENIEALSDNEIAANVINDMRENKIELWQTEEGQKRLQAMIDNTPSLEGHTPDTLIEGMASMNNLNNYYATQLAKRNELLNDMTIVDKMYDNGQMSKSDYFDTQVKLDEELSIVDNNISELNNNIKYKAFYGSLNNEVGIQPGVYSKDELPKVTAHELGHFLGSYAKRKPGTTYLDEELKGLDLKRLEIPFSESSEGNKAHNLFGSPKTEYVNEAIRYFNKGSEGTERVPFLAEVRQDMLDKGLIKHEFDPITPDLLKKHYKQYKETKGEKYPLRMYDIIKDKPKNFNIMSSVLNKLPMIVGAGLMIDELTNDDKDSNVSEAGLGLFLAFLSRNPNAIKTSKRLQGLVNNFTKYGNVVVKEMSTLNRKYLNNAIEKIKAENKDILSELGYNPWEYSSTGSKAGKESLANRRNALFHKIDKRNQKFKDFLSKEDEFYTEMDLSSQQRRLRDMMEMYQEYSITPEGLQKTFPGKFEGVTTTGTKPVTDLSTGQVVNAEVRLPGAREEYKLVNGKLVNKSSIDQEVIISPEYITALKNSRADVETKIPGAKVFGSSVLVTEAGMPHITGDIDVIITQSDYNKNVKDKFGFVQDYGPAKQHAVYPQHGAEGTLDFNIIHEDANGMVAPFYNPAMPAKTPMEIELFRQFYPEKFQEAATKAMVSGKPIEINMTAKEFMAGIDPQVKTVIDSYETSPYNKWGDYNPNKEKHILRPDILIAYGNPEVVAKGQEAYIKSIVGPKGNLGHQFKPEELTDPVKNVDALLKMEFNGDILQTAQDPKRMQLALNDYYINNTVFSREISAASLPGGKYTEDIVKTALTEWFPGKGASLNGIGLNTVQKGNPTHIHSSQNPVIGHRQLGLNLNTSDPLAYVESIIKGTSGNYVFTPEELKIVEELAEKYLPEVKSSIGQDFKSRNILDWYPSNIATDDPKNFLNELSEKTGIRAIRKDERFGGYGSASAAYASVLGKFDEVMDAMMYSLKEYHAAPKTLNERKIALDKAGNKSTSNRFPIKTKEDYQKIYSILDGGARTLESRLMQNERQLEAARVYKENLISKIRTSDDLELIKMDEEIEKLKLRSKEIQSELEYLGKRYNRLNVIQDALLATGIVGGVFGGLGYGLVAYNEREKELKRKKRIEENKLKRSQESLFKNYYKSEKNVALKNDFLQKLPDIAQEWLLEDKWRETWPTGEPYVITKDGYIEPPKKIKKISNDRYKWILPNAPYFNDNNEKKLGGETSMDLELTPEEIKDYISRGYLVYEK